jgi:hypothetical protein
MIVLRFAGASYVKGGCQSQLGAPRATSEEADALLKHQ